MAKKVRRIAGGTGQLERICSSEYNPAMTKRFWDEWRTSRKLARTFKAYAKKSDFDVDAVADEICASKRVSRDAPAAENIRRYLTDVANVNKASAQIRALADTPYNSSNPEHEADLEALWNELLPGVQRDGRVTRQWGRIGFQQSDPKTDFRGGGILGLRQLLHFARSRPEIARRMIVEPADETQRYPWACVGINITNEALKLLDARLLDQSLYGKSPERAVDTFHSIYGDMFEVLHSMWLEAEPENLMAFPPVMKKAMQSIREEIERTGTLVPPNRRDELQ